MGMGVVGRRAIPSCPVCPVASTKNVFNIQDI